MRLSRGNDRSGGEEDGVNEDKLRLTCHVGGCLSASESYWLTRGNPGEEEDLMKSSLILP